MSEQSTNFSSTATKWVWGLAAAAVTAVVVAWATRYFGPPPVKDSDDTFVELKISAVDKAEFDRMLNAIVQGAKAQGITISDANETQLLVLIGWATQRVLSTGKPSVTYIVQVPRDYALAKSVGDIRLTPTHKFSKGENKDCAQLTTSMKVDGKGSVDENTYCLLQGKWRVVKDNG